MFPRNVFAPEQIRYDTGLHEIFASTLISNTRIDGVPELVSELHIVSASQTSVITCINEIYGTSTNTTFISSGT